LLIFRKAAAGELVCEGLSQIAQLSEIDVDETGVGGMNRFFSIFIPKYFWLDNLQCLAIK